MVTFLSVAVAVPKWNIGNGVQSWAAFLAYMPFRSLSPYEVIADAHGPP